MTVFPVLSFRSFTWEPFWLISVKPFFFKILIISFGVIGIALSPSFFLILLYTIVDKKSTLFTRFFKICWLKVNIFLAKKIRARAIAFFQPSPLGCDVADAPSAKLMPTLRIKHSLFGATRRTPRYGGVCSWCWRRKGGNRISTISPGESRRGLSLGDVLK